MMFLLIPNGSDLIVNRGTPSTSVADDSERMRDSMFAIVLLVPRVLRLQWLKRSLFVRLRLIAVGVGLVMPAWINT